MEYLLGALIATVLTSFVYFIFNKMIKQDNPVKLRVTQSRTHYLMYPITLTLPKKIPITQSFKHFQQGQLRVLFTETHAYWIKDNSVYQAELENGFVVEESTKVLDMMGMDKVQLDEMMFIVEKLTEGKNNDYWSSGDSKF